jgi:hypothetical protein
MSDDLPETETNGRRPRTKILIAIIAVGLISYLGYRIAYYFASAGEVPVHRISMPDE